MVPAMLRPLLLAFLVSWPWTAYGLQLPQKPEVRVNRPNPMALDGVGTAVAINGSTLFAAQRSSGPVTVFEKNEVTGAWQFVQELPYLDPTGLLDGYGQNIALQGDIAVISAGGHYPAGIVYVYERSATTGLWNLKQKLEPSSRVGDFFGIDVELSNDVLAIGAWRGGPLTPSGGNADGAVYIYLRSTTTGLFELHQKLVAPVKTAGAPTGVDDFGQNIAMASPDRILIAADGTPRDGVRKGVCYIYEPDAGGVWRHAATLEIAEAEVVDMGETAVSMFTDTAAVTATTTGGASLVGRIHMYKRDSTVGTWSRVAVIDNRADSLMLVSEDQLLVGNGRGNSSPETGFDGAVQVFARNLTNSSWSMQAVLTAPYGSNKFDALFDNFGYLDVDGDVVAVGATTAVVQGQRAGAVWLFSPNAPEIDAALVSELAGSNPPQTGSTFTVRFTASNMSSTATATHPIVTTLLVNDLTVVSMSPGCTVSPVRDGLYQRLICESEALAPGLSWQPAIEVRTNVAGYYSFEPEVLADQLDPDGTNNQSVLFVEVKQAPPSSGGGGVFALASLMFLALVGARQRSRR